MRIPLLTFLFIYLVQWKNVTSFLRGTTGQSYHCENLIKKNPFTSSPVTLLGDAPYKRTFSLNALLDNFYHSINKWKHLQILKDSDFYTAQGNTQAGISPDS